MIGGYAEVSLQTPRFNKGFNAQWQITDPNNWRNFIRYNIENNKPVIFQTEWSEISYSLHYGYGTADIHCAMIIDFNPHTDQILIFDRMRNSLDLFKFDQNHYGWVDIKIFERAIAHRLVTLDYNFDNNNISWEHEFFLILKESFYFMSSTEEVFNPHLFISKGLMGIKLLARTIKNYKVDYRTDQHTKMLIESRFKDNILSHVIGNRFLLMRCFEKTLKDSVKRNFHPFIHILKESIKQWKTLSKICDNAYSRSTPNEIFDALESHISICYEKEKNLLDSIDKCLKISTL